MSVPQLHLDMDRGRLTATGPDYHRLGTVAATDWRRSMARAALVLDTLRTWRRALGCSSGELARVCSPRLLAWARSAGRTQQALADVHARLGSGFRDDLPWTVHQPLTLRAGTPEEHTYRPGERVPPFAHQEVMATVALAVEGGVAFLCDVGTGKTRAAIEVIRAKRARQEIGPVLVVAPKRVLRTWRDEVPLWTPLRVITLSGRVTARADQLRDPANADAIFLTNYEVLDALVPTLLQVPRLGLVFDEAHKLRNAQSLRTRAALKVAAVAPWRLLLTGTPILGGAHEIWPQWFTIDRGLTFGSNYVQFLSDHFTKEYFGKLTPKARTVEYINTRMGQRAVRYKSEDCLDLPPKLYQRCMVEMGPDQRQAYRRMADELIAELDAPENVATAANILVSLLRLSQITSGFVPGSEGLFRFPTNPKLDALEEFVDEHLADHQIVVWCRYREDIRVITERLRRHAPVTIQGTRTVAEERALEAAITAFQGGTARLLVANPMSGGAGLNLQRGSIACYFSQDANPESRRQSEGRIYRAGSEQHAHILYVDFLVEETIDEIVAQSLTEKWHLSETVTNLRSHLGGDCHPSRVCV